MSEYVDIKTSLSDVLSAATNLVNMGTALESEMSDLNERIRGLEGSATWGNDEFSAGFLEGYHRPVGSGSSAGNTADAVKGLGSGKDSLGTATQNLGNMVANAMIQYSETDGANAADISSAGGQA